MVHPVHLVYPDKVKVCCSEEEEEEHQEQEQAKQTEALPVMSACSKDRAFGTTLHQGQK